MSYILDALKKSEQERGQGNVPNVQTMHTSSLNYNNKKAYWPYILIIAIVLNLIAIVFVYLQKDQASTGETIDSIDDNTIESSTQTAIVLGKEAPSETPLATSVASSTTKTSTVEKNTAKPITTQRNTNAGNWPATTNNQSPPKENNDVIAYYDLPASIKQQLPTITISAHVYSSNPLLRSIVINNNFLEEGEYILDGLILLEITADGVIMLFQGTRFHYDVISGWQ